MQTLAIKFKDGTFLIESVRTVETLEDRVIYYRDTYYAAEKHSVGIEYMDYCILITGGHEVKIV